MEQANDLPRRHPTAASQNTLVIFTRPRYFSISEAGTVRSRLLLIGRG